MCINSQQIQYSLRTIKPKLLQGTETVLRPEGKIRMSIFGPGQSAKTEMKSEATRWNANSL